MAAVTPEPELLLKARDLSKAYGSRGKRKVAVEGVDLDIHRGDIYVLIGLSGSGKSTVLRMLNHLDVDGRGKPGHNEQGWSVSE